MKLLSGLGGQGQKYALYLHFDMYLSTTKGYSSFGLQMSKFFWLVSACFAPSLTGTNYQLFQVFPSGRISRSVGPGIEIREDPSERIRREQELNEMTSLE